MFLGAKWFFVRAGWSSANYARYGWFLAPF
jgi:hypothetical protein